MENKNSKYFKYAIGEIILVVIGILIALQINNWSEQHKLSKIEMNILSEINNGLQKDLIDINYNTNGHQNGIEACNYWHKLVTNQNVEPTKIEEQYFRLLRTFVSVQNRSGYESLKSRGLELITNDELRLKIISLYEEKYNVVKNIEENYNETQYYNNFFKEINDLVSSKLLFNAEGDLKSIDLPLDLSEKQKKEMQSYLWKIKANRAFTIRLYDDAKITVKELIKEIELEITNIKK